ncbi:MAG: SDR family NAD(P)-dependent oxidoreductase [Candidatus Omnitrophica bacterium]|nr:SDR family NAD(P)-dependent oxidoreductase [Candidatus Omnitrophota bacterium]
MVEKLPLPECVYDLKNRVTLVTGAAGAIGGAICRKFLKANSRVFLTDLPGPGLENLLADFQKEFGEKVAGGVMDVTDEFSVSAGVEKVVSHFDRLDIAVLNAGIAHVSSLKDMNFSDFRKLERVNLEGIVLLLRELARHFERQATGGDIIVISTKNVFAPGACFGAYSATKAAGHQLARIASLELAPFDVRVNMVAPDAVFSDKNRPSGLWQTIGPERMRSRGLDESGLKEYYRQRNLLKVNVTAEEVANAVLFFASRQTPTTGVTIPVDGGLPEATPR